MRELDGRVALVTGGGSGIGRGIAIALAGAACATALRVASLLGLSPLRFSLPAALSSIRIRNRLIRCWSGWPNDCCPHQANVGTAGLMLNHLDCVRATESNIDRPIQSHYGSFELRTYFPEPPNIQRRFNFNHLLKPYRSRVRLKVVVVRQPPCDPLSFLLTVFVFSKHVAAKPATHQFLRQFNGVLALLQESWSVLPQDWKPDSHSAGILPYIYSSAFELVDCRPSRHGDRSLFRDKLHLRIDWSKFSRLTEKYLVS